MMRAASSRPRGRFSSPTDGRRVDRPSRAEAVGSPDGAVAAGERFLEQRRFSCAFGDPWNCILEYNDVQDPSKSTSYYEATVTSADKPWFADAAGNTDRFFFLHDVTGDGLADMVAVGANSTIKVWVNLDGQSFGCVGAGGSCTVGSIYDDVHGALVNTTSGQARLSFADMNADGVDDIVVLAKQGIFYGSYYTTGSIGNLASGSRPGPE